MMKAALMGLLSTAAGAAGAAAMRLAAGLLTEAFFKRLILQALEALVNMTKTDKDNKLLEMAKEEWSKSEK
jgi:hypothetical protein